MYICKLLTYPGKLISGNCNKKNLVWTMWLINFLIIHDRDVSLCLNDSNPNKLAHTIPVRGRGVPTAFIPVHRSRAHCKHITLPRCPNAYQITHINHTIWAKSMRAPYFPCFLVISTVPSYSRARITQSEALTTVVGVAQFRSHRGLLK